MIRQTPAWWNTPRLAVAARLRSWAAIGLGLGIAAAAHGTEPAPEPAQAQNQAIQPATARLPGYGPRVFGRWPTVDQMTSLGRKIFFDKSLSASGRMACASCHDPAHAYAPGNALSVQRGGPTGKLPGTRATPTLRYLVTTTPFTAHFLDDEEGHGEDGGPTGGLTWSGNADSPHEQALIPLFAANEMANTSPADLARRVMHSSYAAEFSAAFSGPGERVSDDPQRVVSWLAAALEVFQQSEREFYPYSSKYDAYLRHKATLSRAELRGLALFNSPNKGNCASCHPSALNSSGGLPLFTDSSYQVLGVPRNRTLAANRDPRHFDLGLCANGRPDNQQQDDWCGLFKTPTLRNVATRHAFFHNGVFTSLEQVVRFYVQRDTHPERWYGKDARGKVQKFDDLPERYRDNAITTAPFDKDLGDRPSLNEAEIKDVVAFLRTLTDGWTPPHPAPEAIQATASLSGKAR